MIEFEEYGGRMHDATQGPCFLDGLNLARVEAAEVRLEFTQAQVGHPC